MSSRNNVTKVKTTTKIKNYFKGVRAELKKVNWPSKKELKNYTIVVLVTCLIMTVVIWGLDLLFKQMMNFIVK